jgi:hypothetical protein
MLWIAQKYLVLIFWVLGSPCLYLPHMFYLYDFLHVILCFHKAIFVHPKSLKFHFLQEICCDYKKGWRCGVGKLKYSLSAGTATNI